MRFLSLSLVLLLAAGARGYNVPFAEQLSKEQLEAGIQRMADAWTESFHGSGGKFIRMTDEAATYCTHHEPACLESRQAILGLMGERLSGLEGGQVWLRYAYTGGNEVLAGWKAAYICKDGTVQAGSGVFHTRFDPTTGLAVEMNDGLDTAEIGGLLARCAGEDFVSAPNAMEREDLEGLIRGVLDDHRAILSDDPSLSADHEPLSGMDPDVEFGWLGGRARSRADYVRRVASWKGAIKSAAPVLQRTYVGAASVSGEYFAAVECRNGYTYMQKGVLLLQVDPATKLITRAYDLFDHDALVEHFAKCGVTPSAAAAGTGGAGATKK